MSHLIRTIVFGLVFVGLVMACDTSVREVQRPVPDKGPVATSTNPYQSVGEEHNRALASALRALEHTEGGLSILEAEDLALRAIQRHAREEEVTVELVDTPDYQPPSVFSEPYVSISDVVCDSTIEQLTDRQQVYLDDIVFTMNQGYALDTFSEELRDIEDAASEELEARDVVWVLRGAAIARSSTYYWAENVDRWVRAISNATTDDIQIPDGEDNPFKEVPIGIRDVGGEITYIWRDGTRITVYKSAAASAREVFDHARYFN